MAKSISIRMYNVGFGDSFVLRFPCKDRERTMLIDCGVHAAGPGPHTMDEVVDQIIADVTANGHARIDVVVASHRHRDHVLGFENEKWQDVEVGEVWMPWTEDPKDPKARKIRELQSKKAEAIALALRLAGAPSEVLQIAENSLVNAKAMATLHNGFSGNPVRRYLPPKNRNDQTFTTDLLKGVTIHAMGPSRDPEVIRDMNPPAGGAYELAAAASEDGDAAPEPPFDSRFVLAGDAVKALMKEMEITPRDLRGIEKIADEDPLALVVALDKAVNGTSLMLMFEMGNAHLLFPGDAQWGTWQAALGDDEWHSLLERTCFYKVGHHGSHNATPRDFVESVLPKDAFSAMVCTSLTKRFKRIPLPSLLTALESRSGHRVARSDDGVKVKGFRRKSDVWAETDVAI
ncbi:MAG TPA: hypothetical protein VGK04_04370 [Thermoanaerobaculia bacterium]